MFHSLRSLTPTSSPLPSTLWGKLERLRSAWKGAEAMCDYDLADSLALKAYAIEQTLGALGLPTVDPLLSILAGQG